MSFKQRHGMLGLGVLGVGFAIAVLSHPPAGHSQTMAGGRPSRAPFSANPQTTGNDVVPDSLRGDWEKVPYPVLDRLISERAAAARLAAAPAANASGALANR